MPNLWPFSRKQKGDPEAAFHQAEAELRARFEQMLAAGNGRQAVLHAIETESNGLEQQPETPEIKAKLRAYDLIYSEIRPRMLGNLSAGKAHEMAGRFDEAIPYYETAVQDKVPTRFPYEHLRIIYRRQNALNDAQRVCRAALENPFLTEKDHAHFQSWLEKLAYQAETAV